MKLLAFLCIIAVVAAAPALKSYDTVIVLRYQNDRLGGNNYRYGYEQSDGTKVEQVGQIRNEGTKEESLAVSGNFQWIAPNGISYTVTYTADEAGYKPEVEEGPGALPANCVASLCG